MLTELQARVKEGSEVNPASWPGLMQRALALGFVHSSGSVVGVGGIKRPNNSHGVKVFAKAKSKLKPAAFEFELGRVCHNNPQLLPLEHYGHQ